MARVLLVDDDEPVVQVLAHLAATQGYLCDAAFDGARGLDLLRASEYDALIVNWRMPIMDGVDLVRASRSITEGRIPVVFSTGSIEDDPAGLLSSRSVEFLLRRPFEVTEGMTAFAEAIRLRRAWLSERVLDRRARGESVASTASLLEVEACPRGARDRLARAFSEASLPPVRELRIARSPAVGIAEVARHLQERVVESTFARQMWADPFAFDMGPCDGAPALTQQDLLRAAIADAADAIHALPIADRDAPLLALLDAFPARGDAPRELDGRERSSSSSASLVDIICQEFGWFWAFDDGFAVATRPPVAVRRDASGRLHSETGPAIEYADGSGVYAIEGHRVPERAILRPSELTVADVRSASNAEKRRILRERMGEERFRKELVAKVVDIDTIPVLATDPDGPSMTRALVEDATGARTLVGSDGSTDRVYYMRVPRWCSNCAEAAEALCGRSSKRILAEA